MNAGCRGPTTATGMNAGCARNGADEPKSWGRPWGSPTTRATPFRAEDADMKKLLIISVAVTALLVLALGGWVAGSVRRTPAYA